MATRQPKRAGLVASFDFDMAFPVTEIAAGLRRLFAEQACEWEERADGNHYEYAVKLPSRRTVLVSLDPLPTQCRTPTPFADRTLLTARSVDASAAELEALRRQVARAFMRVMG